MTKQEIMVILEDARNASWINFHSWAMSNGEKMMIAMNENDKNWLESKGYHVEAHFYCGEQIVDGEER